MLLNVNLYRMINAQYKASNIKQIKPSSMSEYDQSIRDYAKYKQKGLSNLFDAIEHEINAKLEFVLSQ